MPSHGGRRESLRRFRSAAPTPRKIHRGRPEPKGPTQHLALASPLLPSLPTAPAFLICSRVSVSGVIKPHCLALAPETETVKHRDRTKEQPKESQSVKVEGMGGLFEDCPIFDMYLPEQKGLAKPAPFWNVKPTHEEAEANMELISVAVSVGVSAAMTGNLKSNNVGTLLKSYINPETTVTVTLPLFVNHKHLYVGDQLRYYKPAEEPAEKKRKVEVTDGITDFIKNCKGASREKARRP